MVVITSSINVCLIPVKIETTDAKSKLLPENGSVQAGCAHHFDFFFFDIAQYLIV